jgi:hypothetical protein
MTEFYQIYYREEQKESLFPFAIPFKNEGLTIFFENSVINSLVTASRANKIAVCSWKLKDKLKWYVGRPRPLTMEVLESEYDVLSLTRNSNFHQMFAAAEVWHKGFHSMMKKIVEGIGKKMPGEVKKPIYQNHFSAKREIYQHYVITYLLPAMELMVNDPEVYKMVTVDSGYNKLNKKNSAPSEYLMKQIGMPFYPMAPFLLERLFSVYVHNNRINVTYL